MLLKKNNLGFSIWFKSMQWINQNKQKKSKYYLPIGNNFVNGLRNSGILLGFA